MRDFSGKTEKNIKHFTGAYLKTLENIKLKYSFK